ncbi:hypothetical protein Tco_0969654 [Tanacetum coccineum]
MHPSCGDVVRQRVKMGDGVDVAVVVLAVAVGGDKQPEGGGGNGASEGEWVWGSSRSGHEEPFWSLPEKSAGKLFRRRRGGGRRWGRTAG